MRKACGVCNASVPADSRTSVSALSVSFGRGIAVAGRAASVALATGRSSFVLVFSTDGTVSVRCSKCLRNKFNACDLGGGSRVCCVFLDGSVRTSSRVIMAEGGGGGIVVGLSKLSFRGKGCCCFGSIAGSFSVPPVARKGWLVRIRN